MLTRVFLITLFILSLSCSKEKALYDPKIKIDPYKVYQEALDGLEKGDYFFAQKKFLEAELYFDDIKLAAKSSIMASYSLYSINFFDTPGHLPAGAADFLTPGPHQRIIDP